MRLNPHNVLWLVNQDFEEGKLGPINDLEIEVSSYIKGDDSNRSNMTSDFVVNPFV